MRTLYRPIIFRILVLLTIVLILNSCAATRVTTSEKTAVEQAILSETIERNLNSIKLPKGQGRLVFVDSHELKQVSCGDKKCFSVDAAISYNFIVQKLLSSGFRITEKRDKADLIVYPRLEFVGIDDSDSLIGFPSIPIPMPGVGTVQTPEISIFGSKNQYGRAKFNILAVDAKEGSLIFSETARSRGAYYKRWSALIIFGWRTTNLGKPF